MLNTSVDTIACVDIAPLSVRPRSLSWLDSLIMPQLRYGAVKKAAMIWARAKTQSHAKHFDQSCSSQLTRA